MKELYATRTGDTASHQRSIDARFRKLDRRRQAILRAVVDGWSYRMIAEKYSISVGSVQSAVNGALEAIRKDLAGEPRYNRTGRSGVQEPGPTPDAADVATRQARDRR